MAIMNGPVKFTGSLGDISAYRIKGSDKIILRQKGQPSRHQLKHGDNYVNTRRNNTEWQAVIMAGRQIQNAIERVKHIADYNYSGTVHGLCKWIQTTDTVNVWGQRNVLLTQAGNALEGFSLGKNTTWENILRQPIHAVINRQSGAATIKMPEVLPGINFFNPAAAPLCRFTFSLGMAADIIYHQGLKIYQPASKDLPESVQVQTDWHPWQEPLAATNYQLTINNWMDDAPAALILSAGVEFGIPITNSMVKYVKHSGAAKLLRVG